MQNAETVKYLNIMIEALEKKKALLEELLTKTMAQSECISDKDYDGVNWPQFEIYMQEKDSAINKIEELDDGFEEVFKRVKPELDNNKDSYKDQILKLQELITALTDLGVKISAREERNRQDIERIMTAAKAGIGKARKNMKASSGYIASMYGSAVRPDSMKIDEKN